MKQKNTPEQYLKRKHFKKAVNKFTYIYFYENKNPVPSQRLCLVATLKRNNPSKQVRHHRRRNK